MSVSKETLKAMIREFRGLELSDREIELIRPEVENYLVEIEKLRELDLASIPSGRLLRAQEGGKG